jgi:hypothetical protein
VQKIRSQAPRPPRESGPFNAKKVLAMLDRMLPEGVEDDGKRPVSAACRPPMH